MKHSFLVIPLICFTLFFLPLMAAASSLGNVYTDPNGDGYTAYNLKWEDGEGGIISFDLQESGDSYANDMVTTYFTAKVYRDGEAVGTKSVKNESGSFTTHVIMDVSSHMEAPGAYFFTVYFTTTYNTEYSNWGQISRSGEYVKASDQSPASRVIGNTNETPNGDGYTPFNLRWIEPSEGLIAFDTQATGFNYEYDIIVYRNGAIAGGQSAKSNETTADISSFLKEPAVYYFTVQYMAEADFIIDNSMFGAETRYYTKKMGEAAKSPEYGHGGVSVPAGEAPAENPEAPLTSAADGDESVTAIPTSAAVFIDGRDIAFEAYNINGSNYFKLRDLAYALNGSKAQFEVGFDSVNNAINLSSGQPYSGGAEASGGGGEKSALPTKTVIFIDGDEAALTAYNIDGSNYFMLRDMGSIFDFNVDWDSSRNAIIIDTEKSY